MTRGRGVPLQRWLRRLLILVGGGVLLSSVVVVTYPVLAAGASQTVPEVQEITEAPSVSSAGSDLLTVLTMNLAHGRGTGRHQLLQGEESHRRHLAAAALVLRREAPDIVALQEADDPSFWSGGLDHVREVASMGGQRYVLHGLHMDGLGLHYGTALVSRLPPTAPPLSITFRPHLGSSTKGLVRASFPWPGIDRTVTVVSVHLDFVRAGNRHRQVEELVAALQDVTGPLCILGDLNCSLDGSEDTLPVLLDALELDTWRRGADDIVTFPVTRGRLDWVLVSRELRITDHRVLADEVSDHRAVIATLQLAQE